MKRKYTYRAWMGRTGPDIEQSNGEIKLVLSATKGCEMEWYGEAWPPVRVKVTVEVQKQKGRKA